MPSLSDEIYRRLRDEIIGGVFPAGEALREQNLATRYGSSRTPVRNALKRLDEEGVILLLQNRGARILSWDEDEVSDTYDLRADVESRLAEIAAIKANSTEIEALKEISSRFSDAIETDNRNYDHITHLNYLFHTKLAEIANSTTLENHLETLMQKTAVKATLQRSEEAKLNRFKDQHSELIEALEVHDPEWAASIMRSHILGIKHFLIYRVKK